MKQYYFKIKKKNYLKMKKLFKNEKIIRIISTFKITEIHFLIKETKMICINLSDVILSIKLSKQLTDIIISFI